MSWNRWAVDGTTHQRAPVLEATDRVVCHRDTDELAATRMVHRVVEIEPAVAAGVVENIRCPHAATLVDENRRAALPVHEILGNEGVITSPAVRWVEVVGAFVEDNRRIRGLPGSR